MHPAPRMTYQGKTVCALWTFLWWHDKKR